MNKEYRSQANSIRQIMDKTCNEITNTEIKERIIDELKKKGPVLTSKDIVKKIKKMRNKLPTLKSFETVFAKFNPKELHNREDLEGMLPDYVAGKEIALLFGEDVEEDADVSTGDVQGKDMPLGKKKDIEVLKRKDLEEAASMSSINDLIQDIRDKKIVFADVTQGSRQSHKFYLKGVPEISGGDILLRMAGDKTQFIHIQIEQIKDIRTTKSMAGKSKAVSIILKK
jgi:hypothetical protein